MSCSSPGPFNVGDVVAMKLSIMLYMDDNNISTATAKATCKLKTFLLLIGILLVTFPPLPVASS